MKMDMSNTMVLNAIVVELSISTWTARKLDKGASREVKHAKSAASDDAARVNKNLMAGLDNLAKINDFVALKRNEYYKQTLPWSDLGQRIIPMTGYLDFLAWNRETEQEFNELVSQFLLDYPTLISAQAFQLGALFNRSEYPTADEIRDKFKYRIDMTPLPSSGDFRIDAPSSVISELQKSYEQRMQARVEAVSRDLWDRLHETLTHMSERLGYTDGKKNIFRDSMVTNAIELCGLLKTLNVTGDDKLEIARKQLENILVGVDIKDLRDAKGARDEVKSRIDAVISEWL